MHSEDINSWQKGPELDFDVSLHLKQISLSEAETGLNGNFTFKLVCHPKGGQTLRCVVRDGRGLVKVNSDKIRNITRPGAYYFDSNFNENGVESLTMMEEVSCNQLLFVKWIGSLLSVGTDLKNKGSEFEIIGDSTWGECQKTIFHVKTSPQESDAEVEPKLELDVIPMLITNNYAKVEVTKIRDVNSCNGTNNYVITTPRADRKFITTSSMTEIIITSPGTFESYTKQHSDIRNLEGTETFGTNEETLHIKLKSITEATEDMPEYDNVKTVDASFRSQCTPQLQ